MIDFLLESDLFNAKQAVDLGAVKPDDDLSADVDHWHAHLPGAAHHVTRSNLVTANVNIRELDALFAEILLRHIAKGTGWRAENQHLGLIFYFIHLDTSKIVCQKVRCKWTK